jgi:hypothetical protein
MVFFQHIQTYLVGRKQLVKSLLIGREVLVEGIMKIIRCLFAKYHILVDK